MFGIIKKEKLEKISDIHEYDDGDLVKICNKNGFMLSSRFEPWVPRVGERVRMVKDGLSTSGAVGKLAIVESQEKTPIQDGNI